MFLADFNSITSPPTTPGTQMGGSLTREVDLKPQFSDLDNLFESDSDSNDDAVSEKSFFRSSRIFHHFGGKIFINVDQYGKKFKNNGHELSIIKNPIKRRTFSKVYLSNGKISFGGIGVTLGREKKQLYVTVEFITLHFGTSIWAFRKNCFSVLGK
jgi:hypothetical protein